MERSRESGSVWLGPLSLSARFGLLGYSVRCRRRPSEPPGLDPLSLSVKELAGSGLLARRSWSDSGRLHEGAGGAGLLARKIQSNLGCSHVTVSRLHCANGRLRRALRTRIAAMAGSSNVNDGCGCHSRNSRARMTAVATMAVIHVLDAAAVLPYSFFVHTSSGYGNAAAGGAAGDGYGGRGLQVTGMAVGSVACGRDRRVAGGGMQAGWMTTAATLVNWWSSLGMGEQDE